VVAAGKANHAGKGWWAYEDDNYGALGTEMENTGYPSEPWTDHQNEVMARIHAAHISGINQSLGQHNTEKSVCEHKEFALPKGRKIDRHSIDGNVVRARVAQLLASGPSEEEMTLAEIRALADEIAKTVWAWQVPHGVQLRADGTPYPPEDSTRPTGAIMGALNRNAAVAASYITGRQGINDGRGDNATPERLVRIEEAVEALTQRVDQLDIPVLGMAAIVEAVKQALREGTD
jgi:hypothetical protein